MKKCLLLLLLLCLPLSAAFADNLRLLGLFREVAVFSLNGEQFALKSGQAHDNVHLQRIDLRKGNVTVMMDNRLKQLSLTSHSKGRKESIEADENRLYYTYGKINGHSAIFLVDTGASHITMNADQAKRLNLDYKKVGYRVQSVTASGVHPAYALRLKSVSVGNIVVKDVAALVMDGSRPKTILLGMTFLEKIKMHNEGSMLTLSQ